MERLTKRVGDIVYRTASSADVLHRLAAYEDTGMAPEEVRDLRDAWDMYGGEDGITAAFEALEMERQRWIPVTERLPKKPEGCPKCEIRRTYYLVALKSGCVKTLGYEFDRDEWQITGSPVVAWMPLPEPPKEES